MLYGLTAAPAAIGAEDDAHAMSRLGATSLHGDYLDASRQPDGRWLIDERAQTWSQSGADQPDMLRSIAHAIEELSVTNKPMQFLTYADIDCYVDHQRACDAIAAAALRKGTQLFLWEHLPKALWASSMLPISRS